MGGRLDVVLLLYECRFVSVISFFLYFALGQVFLCSVVLYLLALSLISYAVNEKWAFSLERRLWCAVDTDWLMVIERIIFRFTDQ